MEQAYLDAQGIVAACPACGQKNRLLYSGLTREARCGKCKAPLPAPGFPLEVGATPLFDALLQSAAVPVLVDYWAPWCGPCHMVAPELAKVAAGNGGRLLVVKVNTEELPDLAERAAIRSIPTMALFHNGREIARTSGARPAAGIEAFVRRSLGG